MRGELNAVKDAVARPDAAAYVLAAPANTLPPYYVVEPVGLPSDVVDRRLTESDPALDFEFRLKAVGGSGDTALNLAKLAKAVLSPDGAPTVLAPSGRRLEVSHVRFEAGYEDDNVTIPQTNKHPVVVVETYTATSQPT